MKNAGTLTGHRSGINLATINGVSETTENVSATITPSNGQSAGLVTRYAGAGNMYFAEIVAGKSSYQAYIYRIVNGVQKQLAVQIQGHRRLRRVASQTIGKMGRRGKRRRARAPALCPRLHHGP
jgi:hypothetical protein